MSAYRTPLRALTVLCCAVVWLGGCTGEGSPGDRTVQAIEFDTQAVSSGGAGQLYSQVLVVRASGGAALPDQFELESGVLPPGVSLLRDRVRAVEDSFTASGAFDSYQLTCAAHEMATLAVSVNGAPVAEGFVVDRTVVPPAVSFSPPLAAGSAVTIGYECFDPDGEPSGHGRLLGFPREPGVFDFGIKAISTGELAAADQPSISAAAGFSLMIGRGAINILNPTGAEGTTDPAVPAFPEVIDFVNPSNPQAFFSFAFQIAGGSGVNLNNVYLPRELELSVFDANVVAGLEPLGHDTDETAGSGDKMENDFSDGGVFVLQAGNEKVQIGGFQSPRGRVFDPASPENGGITQHGDPASPTPGYDPDWFQRTPGAGGPPVNSRRDFADSLGLAGGDPTLGTPLPVQFSDYFSDLFEGTHPDFAPAPGSGLQRRKYPFTSDQYFNAFFLPFTSGVDVTPLRYNMIVEAIDTNGTGSKLDDTIARKSYAVQVRIPAIVFDTVFLADGQAGVDYAEFVNASGGVPPLQFDLEWVDGTPADGVLTTGDPINSLPGGGKAGFGIELDSATGQFFGVPRGSGLVDLTIRVHAAVLNPTQNGDGNSFVPTGNPGEFNGYHPVTMKRGIHKTLAVTFAPATAPSLSNASLAPGVDGQAYPGDTLAGVGGVPKVVPEAVGFVGTYPASTAARTFDWSASYTMDSSHDTTTRPDLAGLLTPDGAGSYRGQIDPSNALPLGLALDGDASSATNGQITGVTNDRGFHAIVVSQTDFAIGDVAAPDTAAFRQTQNTTLVLSVSPDTATYLRGLQTSEGAGGQPTGLLEATQQIAEPRMVPMFQAATIFRGSTGESPQRLLASTLPAAFDLLPVMLANGGSDAHVDKSIPSVSGFWPAESGKNDSWNYYFYDSAFSSWKHLQQETAWLQTPTSEQTRVFLWAETRIKKYNGVQYSGASTSSGANSQRYQMYTSTGDRGVLVQNPITGDFWIPAILDNNDANEGAQFGAEFVLASSGRYPGYHPSIGLFGYIVGDYNRYLTYSAYQGGDREMRLAGTGAFIEQGENSSSGRSAMGRGATSVAMSADGVWAATAMPGGNGPKILLWRNDRQPVPAGVIAQGFVTGIDGVDSAGNPLANSACIVDLGGQATDGGPSLGTDQRFLLPDSLMFVRDGLVFLMERQLDHVFGISLVDGHLSAKDVNGRTALSAAHGTGPTVNSVDGQYVPDQDWVRGQKQTINYAVQFSFAGNAPAAGEEGPDKLAFVGGDNYRFGAFADGDSTYGDNYTKLTNDSVRKGYFMAGGLRKALLFLETATGATGLDLAGSTLKDLTGSHTSVTGDFLTPGRPGEQLDFLSVSPDGKYVAVVRDMSLSTHISTYFGYTPVFGSITSSSTTSYFQASDDLLVCSTDGTDLDTASGTQTVLFVGTGNISANFSGTPAANSAAYCSAEPYLNAKGRRISGVRFTPDGKGVIFEYAGHNTYYTKLYGFTYGAAVNANSNTASVYMPLSQQQSVTFRFRTASDGPIDFDGNASSFLRNNLQGLSGIGPIGDTSPPFTQTTGSDQQFWATFKSPNGSFLYYVSDRVNGRNHMVGINITDTDIGARNSFEPFSLHGSEIGFEQFDCNAWNYENRFAAVPAGVIYAPSGRDGDGIIFVVASDASAGATSATDLEVYVFDANVGGDLIPLTSDVTTGTSNAINYLYPSADGNFLVGQRTATTTTSDDTRAALTGDNDLFVVTNVHAALAGAAPNAFVLSAGMSHGSTVAFVGEGTAAGAQALIYSAADSGTNTTWDDRTLRIGLLAPGAPADLMDATKSHYVVLGGSRVLDDDPTNGN